MNASEVNELSDKVFKLLLESDQRKAENEKLQKEEDVDEDEQTMIKEENETEENLHVKIAEFIGILFKTHRDQISTLLDLIINTILPRVLDKNLSSKMH
jgi:sorbitol-specific phosphotransferase system component IIBC